MAEPIRTCVACGRKLPKSNLQRFVWGENEPVADSQGNAAGRGAYCCLDEKCTQKFVKLKKKWKRVFRL